MQQKPFLQATSQWFSFWVGMAVVYAGGGLLAASLILEPALLLAVFGIGAVFFGLTWLCLRIRCPNCKVRLLWRAARSDDVLSWADTPLAGTSCPNCGYLPTQSRMATPTEAMMQLSRPHSWVSRTRQVWKIKIFAGLALGGLLFVGWQMRVGAESFLPFVGLMVTSVIGVAWLIASVRCPRCKGHVAWRQMRDARASIWLVELLATDLCPICQDRGPDLPEPPGEGASVQT